MQLFIKIFRDQGPISDEKRGGFRGRGHGGFGGDRSGRQKFDRHSGSDKTYVHLFFIIYVIEKACLLAILYNNEIV